VASNLSKKSTLNLRTSRLVKMKKEGQDLKDLVLKQ